jgi:hypothetical protein
MTKTNLKLGLIVLGAVLFTAALGSFKSVKQQERKYTLSGNAQDIQLVLKGLSKLPLEEVAGVYQNFLNQISQQDQAYQQSFEKALQSQFQTQKVLPIQKDSSVKKH